MKKILIAVCDRDGSYGEKLGEWISLQKGACMQSVSFSSPEGFLEYHTKQKQDIVLLGRGFLNDAQICEEIVSSSRIRDDDLRKADEGGVLWIRLMDAADNEQIPDCMKEIPAVDKYQPASRILREVFSVYQSRSEEALEGMNGEKEIIGVYSPGHSIWQTPFTLTFAQTLAQKEKVLYVNLNECAGFGGWFQQEYEKDLLDVMYLCLNGGVNVAHCVGSALYTIEGIDYIPPAADGGCLGEISAQDYLKFVKLLGESSGYGVILLDFGMMVPGFFRLLGVCSKVYVATEPGELQKAPLQQFRQMAARQEDAGLEQKLVYLSLPAVNEKTCAGAGKMQQWLWGVMGDFSRRLAGVQSGTD